MDKEQLKIFADNIHLSEAVKRAILEEFSLEGLSTNMTNENIGAIARARLDGRELVEKAFLKINNYKSVPKEEPKANPAR